MLILIFTPLFLSLPTNLTHLNKWQFQFFHYIDFSLLNYFSSKFEKVFLKIIPQLITPGIIKKKKKK